MQKAFLLLRNNQQSGPYDLDELLQLQLKPFDLVWVNGRSAAWQYPGEIPALQPYMPITPQADIPFQPITTAAMERQQAQAKNYTEPDSGQKKVFVSMPRTSVKPSQVEYIQPEEMEKKTPIAEESFRFDQENFRDSYPSTPTEPIQEEGFIKNWNYIPPKKKKSIRTKDLMATLVLAGFIAGGYYLLSKPSIVPGTQVAKAHVTSPVPPPVTEEKKIEEEKKAEPVEANNIQTPTVVENSSTDISKKETKANQVVKKNTKNLPVSSQPVSKNKELKTSENGPTETDNSDVVQQPETNKSKAPAEVKKKKIGQVIKNIFSSKKKTEEPKNTSVVLEEPRPATDRKAARREDPPTSSNTTQVPEKTTVTKDAEENSVSLADLIDITSNAPENWMMGISGLKITLRNRSNVVIQTAAVNVLYYDSNNKLLDRKMVYFSNVPARGKITLPAPDHKWADHVDLKLSAASAKEDRYAQNK